MMAEICTSVSVNKDLISDKRDLVKAFYPGLRVQDHRFSSFSFIDIVAQVYSQGLRVRIEV
jgi:hypothetical protein